VIRMLCNCLCTLDEVETDAEGFVICPTHRVRRYGWKSGTTKTAGVGHTGPVRMGWNPLELEQYELYGTIPQRESSPLTPRVPDNRETRDFRSPFETAMTENRKPGWVLRLAKRLAKEPQPS
jgi:hypothetical protein